MISLLLIEDDSQLGKTLTQQLTDNGYKVTWCQTVSAYRGVQSKNFDIAIVDLNLPDGSGFDVISTLQIPVIIMTAQNSPENRLHGLEMGVHDFIPKPFLFREIHLKIDRLLETRVQILHLTNGLAIDLKARTIEDASGKIVFLNDREYRVLKILIEKAPQVVSRDEILDSLGEADTASHRSIDNIIVQLRHILNKNQVECINSVRGIGYQWIGERK